MPVFTISYDLHKEPGRAYHKLLEAIQEFGPWCRPVESTWFVQTDLDLRGVYDHIKPHLHDNDKVVITPVALHRNWLTTNQPQVVLDWFSRQLNPGAVALR